MTQTYFPFDAGAGADVMESQWAQMAREWLPSGVIAGRANELRVYGSGAGMEVSVATGSAWIEGHFYNSDAVEVLAITAADGALDRIDRIVLRLESTLDSIELRVKEGTPAADPAVPALTQSAAAWEISLAQVYVTASSLVVDIEDVADDRTFSKLINQTQYPDLRNLLVNGGFEIWQRGDGAFTTHWTYTADRWLINQIESDTVSVEREYALPPAETVQGGASSLKFTCTGAGSTSCVQQHIEDSAELAGRTISFTIMVKCDDVQAVRAFISDDTGDTFSDYHTGGGTWQRLRVTRAIDSAATVVYVGVQQVYATECYIDQAMCVIGTVPCRYIPLLPPDDWQRCMRYYEVHGGADGPLIVRGYGVTMDFIGQSISFCVRKAVLPTVTIVGNWVNVNVDEPVIGGIPSMTEYHIMAELTGDGAGLFYGNDAGDLVTAEANP